MKPLLLAVESYVVRSPDAGPKLEMTLNYEWRDRNPILEAMDRVRLEGKIDPLLRLWLSRMPAAERIQLLTEAVTDRLTEADTPDGP